MAVAAAIVAALTLTTAAQAVELDPVAFSPEVSGVVQVGETLTAVMDNAEATYDYAWMVDDAVVGTAQTYDVVADDALKSLVLSVTGHQDGYADTTLETAAVTVQKATFEEFSTSLSGSLVVGKTLKAKVPASGPYTVQWRRDGVAISGATSATYTMKSADIGHRMSVKVVQSAPGYVTQKSIANAAGKVKRVFTASKAPQIRGTARVGKVLTADVVDWSPTVRSYTYQWKRDGEAITGATKRTRKLTVNDLGAEITVTVTGYKPGYAPKSRTSAGTDKVRKGIISAPRPTIAGTRKAGKRLTVEDYAWRITPGNVSLSYQWYRNGKAVSGATEATFALKNVDAGKTLSVEVTYARDGYVTKTRTSVETAKIAKRNQVMRGNGAWKVGVDVKPGLYYSASPTESCTWERWDDMSGSYEDAVAGGDWGTGRRMMQIDSGDEYVYTYGCGGWIRFDGTGLKRSGLPGSGVFKVGVDVRTGTYQSTGNDGCYVAILDAPSGDIADIVESDEYDGKVYLFLDAGAEFVEVLGCNKWTKVS
ncbi:hypothetical protein [Demequina sp. NBRC 110054]|uniref:hypothetical protein n=1 Tax=Demequina sp. NBRC 110054 TaxID=1570343 RepID=UPI000A057B58|nr:hypothetical protein [Demequina sp. NBRC 110054]